MGVRPAPRRPDLPARLDVPIMIGLFLVVVATVMALPAVVAFLNDPDSNVISDLSEALPAGSRTDLWVASSFVGLAAFLIGSLRYRSAGRTGDGNGRRWANVLMVTASFGAVLWALPLMLVSWNGL